MAAFATVEELAEYTRKAIDPSDASAALLLDVASAAIRSYCRQSFDLVSSTILYLIDDPVGPAGSPAPGAAGAGRVTTVRDARRRDSWTPMPDGSFEFNRYGRVWLAAARDGAVAEGVSAGVRSPTTTATATAT
jgi:hypothetical protein